MKENRKGLVITTMVLLVGASVIPSISGVIETDSKEINVENVYVENLILSTETFYPTDDSCISHDSPDIPAGDAPDLIIRNEYGAGGSPGWAIDSLVKFDISSISARTIISSAKLKCFYYRWIDINPVGRELNLYRITTDWDEDTVTWNTQPAYAAQPSTNSPVPPSTNVWMEWDVTSDIQDFVGGVETNFGWKITDENYWGHPDIPTPYYRSKEYSDNGGEFSPYLEIELLEPHTAFLFGRIENLNTEGDLIIFDAVKLRYLQFSPFSFNTYTSGEEIAVVGSGLGIITTSFAFGFFSAALL